MINRYFPQFLKCSLLALAMGPVFSASGQTTVTIGSGTTAAALTPIFSCMDYSYAQMIYTAAEISTAGGATTLGAVTKIRFYLSAGASTNSDNWTVYMGHTTKSTFSSTSDWIAVSSLTSVFSGTVSYPSGSGWLEIPLSSSFTWDGSSNIVVAVDENAAGKYCSNSWNYSGRTNSCLSARRDATNIDPAAPPTGSRTSSRPNIKLEFGASCSGVPTAGTTTASPSSVCLGNTTLLSLSGADVGSSILYQWQSSSDNVTYTDISGATAATYRVRPETATWYRCKVICSTGPVSTNSTPVQVTFTHLMR